jgi:hypothetical protein
MPRYGLRICSCLLHHSTNTDGFSDIFCYTPCKFMVLLCVQIVNSYLDIGAGNGRLRPSLIQAIKEKVHRNCRVLGYLHIHKL